MAATMAQIREGLAANLRTLDGDYQISAYMLANPEPPSLMVVGVDSIDYDLAMQRGLDHWTMVVQGFTGTPSDEARQQTLDVWLAPSGSTSVKAAIESNPTLGGIVAGVRVVRVEAYRDYVLQTEMQNQRLLFGAAWFVDVFNTGH